ncbi:MAG: pilus assembly protein [Hyphomonadaceae bacterium]|nr:MAG: TadE family protein [Caulobacteraceae bacterium]MBT9447004.1 pilus assembly protein [Hyphomonadaceae bacterium]TPW08813.1 MAG: TadE family protein [Alphaproteobacteria bacterium]
MSGPKTRQRFAALIKNGDGAAAVEFALVSIPLFWMLMGTLEFGAMSLVQTSLDSAVAEVGRDIRTGTAQTTGLTKTDLEAAICDNLNDILSLECAGNLFLDVDRYDSFANVNSGTPVANGAMDAGQIGYTPGGANEVILVRAYYQWEVFTPLFGAVFANMQDGKRLVVSSMMFRNEPF